MPSPRLVVLLLALLAILNSTPFLIKGCTLSYSTLTGVCVPNLL